jgi:hypothetical protein
MPLSPAIQAEVDAELALHGLTREQAIVPVRRGTVAEYQRWLIESLRDLADADPSDHATFDLLHDRVAVAMADERDARAAS